LPRRALPAYPVPAAGGWRACRRGPVRHDRGARSARSDGVSRTPASTTITTGAAAGAPRAA